MMPRDDARLEERLGWVLWGGVVTSFVLLIAGLTASFVPAPAWIGEELLRAGLFVLIATPIARVAASLVSYVVTRDWFFVVLTGIVLLELGGAVVAALQGRR